MTFPELTSVFDQQTWTLTVNHSKFLGNDTLVSNFSHAPSAHRLMHRSICVCRAAVLRKSQSPPTCPWVWWAAFQFPPNKHMNQTCRFQFRPLSPSSSLSREIIPLPEISKITRAFVFPQFPLSVIFIWIITVTSQLISVLKAPLSRIVRTILMAETLSHHSCQKRFQCLSIIQTTEFVNPAPSCRLMCTAPFLVVNSGGKSNYSLSPKYIPDALQLFSWHGLPFLPL